MSGQQNGASTHLLDQFEFDDLGAPFKIILMNAVLATLDRDGNVLRYKVPDKESLIQEVILSRILDPHKLSGKEIKFLRKAVRVKQKDLAVAIDMRSESLSRCESHKNLIGPASEKLIRIFLFKTAIKHYRIKSYDAGRKLIAAMDELFGILKPLPVQDEFGDLALVFCRRRPEKGEEKFSHASGEECWEQMKALDR